MSAVQHYTEHAPGAYGIQAVDPESPGAIVCGACGRAWAEDITPAGRCPWEDEHEIETAIQYLYASADEIRAGDILPDVSRFPVATVVTFPHESVRVTFAGTEFVRRFDHGGPGYGFAAVRIERSES